MSPATSIAPPFGPVEEASSSATGRDFAWAVVPRDSAASADRLYHNEQGRLQDRSRETGIGAVEPSYGLGVLFSDLSGDGRSDIYVANNGKPNFLFINRGDGTFGEEGLMRGAAYSGDGREQAGMGVDSGDIDEDGDLDLVVTNFSHDQTTLYENLGAGFFADASYKRGIGKETYFPLSWGARFVNLDADGALNLFIANGHIYPAVEKTAPETSYAAADEIFLNDGKGDFSLVSWESPVRPSRGVASGDYDGDGRIDLIVTTIDGPPELLHNETPEGGKAVLIQLVGTRSSREGLGALVTLETAKRIERREVVTSGSHASAQDPRLHFGTGGEDVRHVEVRWPSGVRDRVDSPPSISLLVIKEGVGLIASFPLAR